MKNKGFTLIETLVVIAIIAFLAVIVRPFFNTIMDNVRRDAAIAIEKEMKKAAESYVYVEDNLISSLKDGESIEIYADTLIDRGYIKTFKSPYSNNNCYGKVNVLRLNEDDISYYPYLNCDDRYITSNDTEAVKQSLVERTSHVFNSGPNNYTITINLRDPLLTYNDARRVITPSATYNIYNKTHIEYATWVPGTTGNSTGYSQNGSTSENSRILFQNPWRVNDTIWASLANDVTSDAEGGWGTSSFPIEHTNKYRFSVFIRRENTGTGSGTTYFGLYGYNTAGTSIGVLRLSDSVAVTNAYFGNAGIGSWPLLLNNWMLFVAHVHPSNYSLTTNDPTSGIYDLTGVKRYNLSDFKWQALNSRTMHRSYLYYSTKVDERQYWYRPRVDLVNGTEPTIEDLINGTENPNINGTTNLITNGVITYTAPTIGTYNFQIVRKDGSFYNFSHTIK